MLAASYNREGVVRWPLLMMLIADADADAFDADGGALANNDDADDDDQVLNDALGTCC